MDGYKQLKKRRDDERALLAKLSDPDARARVQSRIARLSALIADHQSKYSVPVPCVCLK